LIPLVSGWSLAPHACCFYRPILLGCAPPLATRPASVPAFLGPRDHDISRREHRTCFPLSPTIAFVRSFFHPAIFPPSPSFVRYFVRFWYPSRMLSPLFSTTSNFILAATLLFASVEAIPLPGIPEVAERNLETRAVNIMSATDISGFTPFTQFARAAYCQPSKIKNWSCGRELNSFPF